MPFIGNQPALSYTSFAKQDFTTSATTSYTLDNPVANENELALFINFVRQEPTTAYTASGTSLTLTSATSASDDMYCVYLGKAVQTVNPPSGSVGAAQMDLSQDYTFTGKISGQNYPAFAATKTANQDVTSGVNTKVTFDSEIFDTDNAFSDSKFTVPSGKAGKYQINSILNVDALSDANLQLGKIFIYKNGSSEMESFYDFRNNNIRKITMTLNLVLDLSVSDYLEVYTNITAISGTPRINRDNNRVHLSVYRIGD